MEAFIVVFGLMCVAALIIAPFYNAKHKYDAAHRPPLPFDESEKR